MKEEELRKIDNELGYGNSPQALKINALVAEVRRLKEYNTRLKLVMADVIHSPKYMTESCGQTIVNLSCDISIIEEAVNALAGDK